MSFLTELKQRKVFRVGALYLVVAWVAIQAASIALPAFAAPDWSMRVVILVFALGFPLALLRPKLARMNLNSAIELDNYPTGRLVRTTGIVTCRQRPGTASGVVFVTLEDETGITNVVVWNQLVLKQRREILNSRLLTVYGVWQCEGEVKHVIAKRLVDHSHLLGNLKVESRDFH